LIGDPADPDRVRWLTTLAAACERILAREEQEPSNWSHRQIRQDVDELLARIRTELKAER
jgi:hypothetical protein